MLTIQTLKREDIHKAVNYYLSMIENYYTKPEEASSWFGKGATLLSLEGPVTREKFSSLLAGHVSSDKPSSRHFTRHDHKNRLGYDLTFSAPKSISLQALVGCDDQMILCHQRAVQTALATAERLAQTRLKIKGKTSIQTTSNLIVACFRDDISRDDDPQLHTHAIVMNLTQRGDGQWRALKNDEIIKRLLFLGKVYRTELAQELIQRGYRLRHDKDGFFELAQYSDHQLRAFSQRTQTIDALLTQQGLTRQTATTSQKQQATFQTRSRKNNQQREKLVEIWRAQAQLLDIRPQKPDRSLLKKKSSSAQTHLTERIHEEAQHHLSYAIAHLTERQAVVSQKDLITTALTHSRGYSSLEALQKTLHDFVKDEKLIVREPRYMPVGASSKKFFKTRHEWIKLLVSQGLSLPFATGHVDQSITKGKLVCHDIHYTTPKALADEQALLQLENQGRYAFKPLMKPKDVQPYLKVSSLKQEQKRSLEMILTTPHRVTGIQGFAGVGKSHLLKSCCDIIHKQGHRVDVLAPYNNQVKDLQHLGVKACTVASFLKNAQARSHENRLLIIDEAGLISTRMMKKLLTYTEKNHIRTVLLGDVMQMPAVEAGRPFAQLQAVGMTTLRLEDIQRQKNISLKTAVQHAAQGHTKASLESIKETIEIKSPQERYKKMAYDYSQLEPSMRQQTILLTGTNAARRSLNKLVREELKLFQKGYHVQTLCPRDLTQAQKSFARYYQPGDILIPEKDYKRANLTKATFYQVQALEQDNQLLVSDLKGHVLRFNPAKCRSVSVYEKESIELSVHDQVRVNFRDKALSIEKGDCFEVQGINDRYVILKDAHRQISLPIKQSLPLSHAYASTVHGCQGMNCHNAFIDIQTKSQTTNKNMYYVAISRARQKARIYTDSRKDLLRAISRDVVKESALKEYEQKNNSVKSSEEKALEKDKSWSLAR